LYDAVDQITAALEAGMVPAYDSNDIVAALCKDAALSQGAANMVCRVLTKIGLL
jgi:hypothetical protein